MDKYYRLEQAHEQKCETDFLDLLDELEVKDLLAILAAADIHLTVEKLQVMYEKKYDSNLLIKYLQNIYEDKKELLCQINTVLEDEIFSFLINRMIQTYYDPVELPDPLQLLIFMDDVSSYDQDCLLADIIQWLKSVDGIKVYNDCSDLDDIFWEVDDLEPMDLLLEWLDPYDLADHELPLVWDFFTAVVQLCHDFNFSKQDELMDLAALMIFLYDPDYQKKVLDQLAHESFQSLKPYIHLVNMMYRHGKMAESKKLALAIKQLKADDLVAQFDIPELLAIFKSA
ncbi:hypothetical protein SG0102_13550 [Intestinibaculum porci]|uniref:Uncharacterized protein n=1 Tax=Intestinibaculum porci TaxID=2487118 RepID=A0A3G9JKA5_9FIRM|nr:hypothetical protein [Intestinibaculum porci]BBH26421.1 hypothetical protein SG0102_13550 [Intestinibaculum porci]